MQKLLIGSVSVFFIAATTLFAAETEISRSGILPSSVSLKANVWTGARSDLLDNLEGGNASNTIGPFIRPLVDLGYKGEKFSARLVYEFAVSGAQGWGHSNNHKDFQDNFYTFHEPTVTMTGILNENWLTNFYGQVHFDSWNNKPNNKIGKNDLDFQFSPDLEYRFSPEFSVSAGYFFDREMFLDANAADVDKLLTSAASAHEAVNQRQLLSQAVNASKDPVKMLHAGIVTSKWQISDGTNLVTFVRGGRVFTNVIGSSGHNIGSYQSRLQSDLSTKITRDLSLALRYRFNADTEVAAKHDVYFYNRGRAVASYAFTKNWALKMQDEFTASQSNAAGKKASYENENYLGVNYFF